MQHITHATLCTVLIGMIQILQLAKRLATTAGACMPCTAAVTDKHRDRQTDLSAGVKPFLHMSLYTMHSSADRQTP